MKPTMICPRLLTTQTRLTEVKMTNRNKIKGYPSIRFNEDDLRATSRFWRLEIKVTFKFLVF